MTTPHVTVIGAGIVGMTTAFFLARHFANHAGGNPRVSGHFMWPGP